MADEAREFFLLQEDAAHRMAYILGKDSAASLALADLAARRKSGEDSVIWRDKGGRWIVGPRPVDVAKKEGK